MTAWETCQVVQAGREAMLTMAWMTGNYARAAKLPPLDREIAKLRPESKTAIDPLIAASRMAGPQPSFSDVTAAWGA